ncbi:hypothetical protein IPH92_00195 [Candidatus Kaiserbacteria bacterium]|nr:MAG: hypothetical protein IPH92_00195 [Candidatus Kaiserbacteria bacterium]
MYRCLLSTGCDASGDFTTAWTPSSPQSSRTLVADSVNNILYMGGQDNSDQFTIYRCALSSGCDFQTDFTTAYAPAAQIDVHSLTIASSTLYAGSGNGGNIYRCLLSTGCDADVDFTLAYNTTESQIYSLTSDSANGVLYVGTSPNGIIYRCLLTTGCDASGDFTTATDTPQTDIYALTISSSTLYAGTGANGVIYQCLTSTGCDSTNDFTTATDTPATTINALVIDFANSSIYAGSGATGIIYKTSIGSAYPITERGTCWGTSPNPVTNCLATSGTSTGAFTHARTGLPQATLIYARAYVTYASGTAYSADVSTTTLGVAAPTLSSGANQAFFYGQATTTISTITITDTPGGLVTAANDIRIRIASTSLTMKWDTTDTTATFGGTASAKVSNPVSYENNGTTLVIPVDTNFGTGDTLTIDGLSFSQFLGVSTATIGLNIYLAGASDAVSDDADDKTMSISSTTPTVTTPTTTAIGLNSATLGATITSDGGGTLSARGTCWGTSASPVTNCTAEGGTGTGVFTQARTGMATGTLYYYRGYATNASGTTYSADGTFSTNAVPVLTTPTATAVGSSTATLGATLVSTGTNTINARGTCWDTNSSPTINCLAEGGTGTGAFTQARTGLTAGTLYYYRGYTTYTDGASVTRTAYSADGTFVSSTTPTLTTPTVTAVSFTTATFGANITSDGGAPLSARGTCWGTSASPVTNCLAEGGTGTGVFTQARTGLPQGTLIYARAYATNAYGTSYSADISTTTSISTSDLIISGTLYSDEGVTTINGGKTIALAIGTTTPSVHTTTSNGSGVWTATIPTGHTIGTSTPILAWVDNDGTTRAALLTKATSTSNISGLSLYKDRVIVSHEATSGTSTTLTDMSFYDNDNDSDIQYNATTTSAGLVLNAGNELHIQTGKSFTPLGAVTIQGNAGTGTDGSLHLPASSIYTAGGTTTLAGNFTASSSATFTPGTHTLTFNATTTGKSIDVPLATLGNTTFNGAGGAWAFASAATTSALTITAGTLTAPATSLTILGNYQNSGTFTHNNATVTIASTTAAQGIMGTATGTSAFSTLRIIGATTTAPTSGLVGKWMFEEGSGTTVRDASGGGNTGTLNGTPSWISENRGKAISLNGTTDYVAIPNLIQTHRSDITIATWFKTTTTGVIAGYQAGMVGSGPSSYVPAIYIGTDNKIYAQLWDGATHPITTSGTYTDGAWHHVALAVSGGNSQSLYVDGSFVGILSNAITDFGATYSQFGAGYTTGWTNASGGLTYFAGSLDDNRIYNRALTANEISDLYNERPKVFSQNASTTNLIIESGVVSAPPSLSIAGDYQNAGAFLANAGTTTFNGTTTFSGVSAQTLGGTMTGASAFGNVEFTGGGLKSFATTTTNASTSNFMVDAGATVVAPENLSVSGQYTNNGTSSNPGGKVWTSRTAAAYNIWQSVTYGNGLFVAVSGTGAGTINDRVMTSPDGITWTPRTAATNNYWYSVTYGNGLFVAVAGSGTISDKVMTSPDGITWTPRTAAADNTWRSVTYGNGVFVAVSGTGAGTINDRVMTSPDGITWTPRTAAANNSWWSVTYGNGLFVAVAETGTINDRVMTSPDGINWTAQTAAANNNWVSVTYGNGLFVAVAFSGTINDRVMTSPDGITWTPRTVVANNTWVSVTYGNGLFVAVSGTGAGTVNNRVMTSPDGINWTAQTAAANNEWVSVTYGNGLFVAVAYSGFNRVMTSAVGTTTFSGVSAQTLNGTMTGASAFGNVAFTNTSATTTFASNASTSNFTTASNTIVVAPSSLSLSGDYTNNGRFVAGTGTTTFNGNTTQTATGTMTGTSAFSNLTITNSVASTTFVTPLTVSGKFTATTPGTIIILSSQGTTTFATAGIIGSSTESITLRATTPGTQAPLDIEGTYTLSYINVKDSNACDNAIALSGTGLTDSGNNTCWTFASGSVIVLSGILYSDEGTTPITAPKTLGIMVGTSTLSLHSTTSAASGAWSFTVPAGHTIVQGTPILVWVDNDGSTRASLVTKADSSSADISGLNLYQNRVIVSHEGAEAITLLAMTRYNNSDDADIQFEAVDAEGYIGQIFSGNKLYINAGKTFSPDGELTIGANASSSSVDGALHIASGATYKQMMPNNNWTYIGGSLTASSTATIINNGTFQFTASTTGKSINATQPLGKVTFANTASMSFATSATTTNLTINAGASVVAPASTLTILGDYTNNGTFTHNGGTILFASTTQAQFLRGTLSGTSAFGTLSSVGNTTTSPSGLIGKWNLDEGSGTEAYDSSGNGNTGTLTNGPTWKAGKVGQAVDLGGDDDYINVGSPASLDDVTQKTITAWINPVTLGDSDYGRIADKDAGTATGWLFYVSNGDNVSSLRFGHYFAGGLGFWNTGNNTITTGGNTWQHVAVTYDNSSASNDPVFYINGVLSPLAFDTNNSGAANSDAAHNLWFGDRAGNDRSFNGDMDDIRMYNRILTAGEIATIYNERPKFINANASTTNLSIDSGVVALSSTSLSIAGNYTNSGTLAVTGTTTFNGNTTQTATGTMTGSSAFKNVEILNTSAPTIFGAPFAVTGHFKATSPSISMKFAENATTSLNTATLYGTSGNKVQLRSTTEGTRFGIEISGAYDISYVDVKDSSGSTTLGNITATTSVDSGNNNRWTFIADPVPSLSSASNQSFYYSEPTTTISTLTITDTPGGLVTATNDIRIRIASTSLTMKWDTTDTTATFGGTASGKVSNPVSYENNGTTLVIPVSNDFSAADTLTVDGLSFTQFLGVSTATTGLNIYLGGASDAVSDDADDKTMSISGLGTLLNHTSGQVSDNINSTTETGIPLFAFNLSSVGENSTISNLTLRITGANGVSTGDLSNFALYRDNNNSKTFDAGDTAVGGSPSVTLTGDNGTVTFSTPFSATSTARNYVLVGSVDNVRVTEGFTLNLSAIDVALTGDTTGLTTLLSTLSGVQHMRGGGGGSSGGGVHAGIGGAPPAGDGIRGGGGGGGGGGVDPDSGTPIGNEPGFNAPSGQGSPQGGWTNGTNVYTSNGVYTTTSGNGSRHTFTTFGFDVPLNNTIVGVEVKVEASGSTAAGTISIGLSWNNGSTLTSLKTTSTLGLTDTVFVLGGSSDNWGRTWTPLEFANGSFAIEIIGNTSANTLSVDAIQAKVYHQATGGGGGGGGAI